MAITRDQVSSLATTSSATSLNIVWSTAPAAGATVVVFVFTANGTPSSVVDNGTVSSTFTADVSNNLVATAVTLLIYRANSITLPSAGSYTVTVNITPSQTLVAGGVSYLGVKSGAPTATNTNKASNNGPVSTGNVTPAAGGALAFAAEFDELPGGNDNIVLTNASFTEQFTENTGTLITGGCADWINAGPSAANCTWTIASGATAWAAAIAVYDAAPSAATGTPPQLIPPGLQSPMSLAVPARFSIPPAPQQQPAPSPDLIPPGLLSPMSLTVPSTPAARPPPPPPQGTPAPQPVPPGLQSPMSLAVPARFSVPPAPQQQPAPSPDLIPPGLQSPMSLGVPTRPATQAPPPPPPAAVPGFYALTPPGRLSPMSIGLGLYAPSPGPGVPPIVPVIAMVRAVLAADYDGKSWWKKKWILRL